MKRLYLIIYVLATALFPLSAQVTSPSLQGRAGEESSLATALDSLATAQTEYAIHFIHNNLEHLRVSARPSKNLRADKAVARVCKGQPVKVKTRGKQIFVQYKPERDLTGKTVHLSGCVEDGFLEMPLPYAKVSILRADSSVVVDSAQIVVFYGSGMKMVRAQFNAEVSAAESQYLVRASQEGYDDVWQRVTIPRPLPEDGVEVPTLKMRRGTTKTMREVTVTATKIKMFYRGDTLIYDATAFRLPDGSMLDDLIRQLPGVTMNVDGEIFVNGRKVDELLLGSRSFFGGNKKVLLENLPYYTVKNLKVYEKQTDKSVALGYDVEPRRYVMDVNLKDEYSQGYIGNVEAAGGTQERWLARGFLLGFTDRLRFTLLANANNVNEGRHIGQSDQWNPARQPRSLLTTRSVAGELNYQTKGDKLKETFSADYTSSTDEQTVQQRREQFIDGCTPTSVTESFNRAGNRRLSLNNTLSLSKPFYLYSLARYSYASRDGSFNSAFDQWSDSLTVSQRTVGVSEGRAWNAIFDVQGSFNVGKDKKHLEYFFHFEHSNDESERATRYETRTATPSEENGGATHNSNTLFNRSTWFLGRMGYQWELPNALRIGISDGFFSRRQHNRDYLYHPVTVPEGSSQSEAAKPSAPEGTSPLVPGSPSQPDALVLGGFPAEDTSLSPLLPSQLDALTAITDAANSYDSRDRDWSNDVGLMFYKNAYYVHPQFHAKISYQRFALEVGTPLSGERLHYHRGTLDTLARQTVFLPKATFRYRNVWKGGRRDLNFNVGFSQERTLLLDRITFRDDSQPLIVKLGNPDLKPTAKTTFNIRYYDSTGPRNDSYNLSASFDYHHRDIAQSLTYDPATGISTYKPMNISGAYAARANFGTNRTIGEKRYWTWHLDAGADWNHSKDHALLEGENESSVNTVNTLGLNSGANIRYNRKTLNVRAVGSINWRHSAQPLPSLTGGAGGGSSLSALDFQYGLEATYTTPALWGTRFGGLTLAADGTMFSRRGYGTADLNRNNFVVNASLSQSLAKGRFILSLQAFDLLHQLSPIDYSINAQGRTVTWYRSLPHYVMLHAVWHFNKNPKKR
ncbi:MAG: outer membrane beta-barrel protein [Bacteroidaceae bacterium]|nr:outer membrane beta-barrel protein [Bacteroidaceae bacterium]